MKQVSKYSPNLQTKIDLLKKSTQLFKTKNLTFNSRLILAPLAGITNSPFRRLMESLGAGGTFTELISAHAINYKNSKTIKMITPHKEEKILGVQIFGENSDILTTAAQIVEEYGATFIDINLGCPAKKVIRKGAGAALLEDELQLAAILKSIKSAVTIPISVKIRSGINEKNLNAHRICKIAEDEGFEFVSIHGRTLAQNYTGFSNWHYIEQITEDRKIPIVGNGDLNNPIVIRDRLNQTKCRGLMIGRGSLRNPFLFLEGLQANKKLNIKFSPKDYLEVIHFFYHLLTKENWPDSRVMIQLKKHIVWYSFGSPKATSFRQQIFKADNINTILNITSEFFLNINIDTFNKKLNTQDNFLHGGHG